MSSRSSDGRRIGVWAADPITQAGLVSLLPLVGFEAVVGADLSQVDALLVATDQRSAGQAGLFTAAADVEGVPVVWMHRDHESALAAARSRTASESDRTLVAPDDVSVEELGKALLAALLSCFDGQSAEVDGRAPLPTPPISEDGLSDLERQVLQMLADGHATEDIASTLFYSERTVKNAIAKAVHRLGAANRAQAVAVALRRGYF